MYGYALNIVKRQLTYSNGNGIKCKMRFDQYWMGYRKPDILFSILVYKYNMVLREVVQITGPEVLDA